MAVDPFSVEGLINFIQTGTYDPATGATTPEEYIAQWIANGGIGKIFAPLDPSIEADLLAGKPWHEVLPRGLIKAATSPDTVPAERSLITDLTGTMIGTVAAYLYDRLGELNEKYPGLHDGLLSGAATMMQHIVNVVVGADFPKSAFNEVLTAPDLDATRKQLGDFVTKLLQDALPTEATAAGFLAREPGTAEWDNYARISGLSMRLQLGDILTSWISGVLPFSMPDGFKDIAERIDKAIALEDSIEEIIQVPMQAAIQRGLEQYYNRKIKPIDYSDTEVNQLFLADKIGPDMRHKVLDNLGVRDDIRDKLLDLAAPNLTESDIDQAYQHNLLSADEVKATYQDKSFREPERSIKTELVVKQRRWKLEEKVFELYGNLYRDGVATREEVTPHLEHFGYEADEVDMWFQVQELERRQRRWLTKRDVSGLVGSKVWTVAQARDYMVMQGMTTIDATLLFQEEIVTQAIKALPKAVKDQCAEILSPEALLKDLLAQAIALGPADILSNQYFKKLLDCVLEKIGVATP